MEEGIVSRGADHVAGVFVEPISAAKAAAVVPPDGYLQGVRELCDRYGVLMICDETVTAFGRTGTWFGVDHWGVQPDIATFAKGVTSGMTPMSGMAVAGHVAAVFAQTPDGFPWGHTFSGNPLGCAVACEVIRTIREEGLVERARGRGARLRGGPERVAGRPPWSGPRPARRTSARCAAGGCCRASSSSPTAAPSSHCPVAAGA